MESIKIETTQNVQINYQVASVGERIVATILDGVFLAVLFTISAFVVGMMGGDRDWVFVFMIIPLFYSLLFETFMNGQTPGKRIMSIKVSRLDGGAPRFSHYLIRWLFRLVDIQITSGVCAILTIVIGEKGQRVGDLLAGTAVIRTKQKMALQNTIFEEIPEDYQLSFPQAGNLTENDLRLIKKVMTQLNNLEDPVEKLQFGLRARKMVKEQMNIDTEMKPEDFFPTLLKDYNYIYRRNKD